MSTHRPNRRLPRIPAFLLVGVLAAGCALGGGPSPSPILIPSPTCGGIKIGIPNALSCEAAVKLALRVLERKAPEQLARGITAVAVELQTCPTREVPQQLDCAGEPFAQLVTFTFSADGPMGGSRDGVRPLRWTVSA